MDKNIDVENFYDQMEYLLSTTTEIVNFTRAILKGKGEIDAVDRPGKKPEIIRANYSNIIGSIIDGIENSKQRGAESIAVICKTADQSSKIYRELSKEIDVNLITKADRKFKEGIVIIPSYLVKGLEFDSVIVYLDLENNYNRENERKLLYTICTRALHQLYIYYTDKLTPFVTNKNEDLYLHYKLNKLFK